MINYRPYTSADRKACLAIFQSNTPHFFGADEAPEFEDFLERLPCPYYMLEVDHKPVGCGGYFLDEQQRVARMCWGMIQRTFHKRRYGKYLLLRRLDEICQRPNIKRVSMDTSQHSKGFFEKLGFVVQEVELDGYFSGLHRHEMELKLDSAKKSNIHNTLINLERELEK